MMQLSQRAALAVLALVLGAGAAWAETPQAGDVGQIVKQQQALRVDVEKRAGAFKDIDKTDRDELLARQSRVLAVLAGKQNLAQLGTEDRAFVDRELAWIDGAIARAEDDRMVCRMEKKLGSNRPERVCMTASQMREQQQRAREEMTRAQRSHL